VVAQDHYEELNTGQAWWYIAVRPALGKLRQEDCEFEARLGYTVPKTSDGNVDHPTCLYFISIHAYNVLITFTTSVTPSYLPYFTIPVFVLFSYMHMKSFHHIHPSIILSFCPSPFCYFLHTPQQSPPFTFLTCFLGIDP
jgi:hypothetical protein